MNSIRNTYEISEEMDTLAMTYFCLPAGILKKKAGQN
jgi:hypothetical protein